MNNTRQYPALLTARLIRFITLADSNNNLMAALMAMSLCRSWLLQREERAPEPKLKLKVVIASPSIHPYCHQGCELVLLFPTCSC